MKIVNRKLLKRIPRKPRISPFYVIYKPFALDCWYLAVWNREKKQHQNAIEASTEEELEFWLDLNGIARECIQHGIEA